MRRRWGATSASNPMGVVEWYAELFARMGFEEQHVNMKVYLHRLAGPEEVVEWVKGSLLTDYRTRLAGEDYEAYLAEYQERLLAELPEERPYLLTFKRLLLWGRRGGASRRGSA